MNTDIRNLSKWLNEEQETPIDRQALARVLAMAQQEPVAWLVECGGDSALVRHTEKFPGIFAGNEFIKRPLVFGDPSPPASKPWVGLTDDEILYCVELENPKAIAEEVEAKLKEKNT